MVGVQLTPDPGPGRGAGAIGKGRSEARVLTGRWRMARGMGGGALPPSEAPSKGGHTLPLEERLYVIREMVKRWNPHVKISPVAPLSWPGEVVDGALWLLTRAPRKTTLHNLGGEPDKVIETLLDAFENNYTPPMRRIRKSAFPQCSRQSSREDFG